MLVMIQWSIDPNDPNDSWKSNVLMIQIGNDSMDDLSIPANGGSQPTQGLGFASPQILREHFSWWPFCKRGNPGAFFSNWFRWEGLFYTDVGKDPKNSHWIMERLGFCLANGMGYITNQNETMTCCGSMIGGWLGMGQCWYAIGPSVDELFAGSPAYKGLGRVLLKHLPT